MFSKNTKINKFTVDKNREFLPALADTFEEQVQRLIENKEYFNAIKLLSTAKKPSKTTKLSLANCYEYLEQYDQALKILYTIPRYARDTLVSSSMNQCYEKRDRLVLNPEKDRPLEKISNKQKVVLPGLVQKIFARLFRTPGEPYLVGSTIHSLLYEQVLRNNQDIDMVFALPEGQTFQTEGFIKCPYNHFLYTSQMEQVGIDCYVVSGESKSFVEHNAYTRDFTIGCLYINYLGVISDPTGYGLNDLENKILRTVIPSVQCFQNDPVRLLRAIKWIIAGFKPTEDVIDAMKNWQPSANLEIPHLNAVARRHLLGFNKEQQNHYMCLLNEFGLGQKLFFCPEGTTLSLFQLKQNLNIIEIYTLKKSPPSFFKYYFPNMGKGLTACAIERATHLCATEDEERVYLKKQLKHSPVIDSLDLHEPNLLSP